MTITANIDPLAGAPLLARRWRAVTVAAIAVLAGIGWVYLVLAAMGHHAAYRGLGMEALSPLLERHGVQVPGSAAAGRYGPVDLVASFAMWSAMVLAMMLPTAASTLKAYAISGRSVAFVGAGYVAVWLLAALVGALAQVGLASIGALSPLMEPAGRALAGSILIAAGLYQFTPLKRACLVRCRNPRAAYLGAGSSGGALRLGVEEGLACLGCCWALMAVMFAAGVMNLVAMAFLGALMATEKVVSGRLFTYAIGIVLLFLGFGLASGPFFG